MAPTSTLKLCAQIGQSGAPIGKIAATWLGRMLGGAYAEYLMTKMPGVSNERAGAELGWRPLRPSWRIGFREDLAAAG